MTRRRILVADDSATIQKVIKIAFSRHNYEIVEASSYIEALTAQSRASASVVIADASLPGAHGPSDFSKLSQGGRTPLLLLVGSYESVDEDSFRSLGFSQFLKKPFESGDIVALVDQMVAKLPDTNLPPPPSPPSNTLTAGSDRSKHTTVIHEGGIGISFGDEPYASGKTDPLGKPGVSLSVSDEDRLPPPPVHAFTDETKKGRKAFTGGPDEVPSFKLAGEQSSSGRVPPLPFGSDLDDDSGLPDLGFMTQGAGSGMDITPPPSPPLSTIPPLPPKSGPGTGQSFSPTRTVPPPPVVKPEDYLDKIEKLVEDSVDDRLPPLVRKAIEDYCDRHFKSLAREVITSELRRLAEEKARHLVDN